MKASLSFATLLIFSSCVAMLPAAATAQDAAEKTTSDWPMWGGSPDRNMVSDMENVAIDFEFEGEGGRLQWTSQLGSQTYGNPVVSNGKVFVGTNNGGGYREKHPADQDKGVLLCFDEKFRRFSLAVNL